MKVAVITPTIGSDHFDKCLQSVQNQTYQNLTHYIFLDGEQHYEKINYHLDNFSENKNIKTISLQDNVGKEWYGHRVYAASSFLVNADIICYLDEDNWFDTNHIQTLINKLSKGYDWVYSLRKIYDKEGSYICDDDCESLGKWPVFFNDNVYHIDTSSFAVRRDVAVKIGHAWYGKWGADRQFFNALKHYFKNFECTNQYTSCYRLDGNPNSVKSDFFIEGNRVNKEKYSDNLPWKK